MLLLLASAVRAETQDESAKINDPMVDDILAGREPLLKGCQEYYRHEGTTLRLLKSFAAERVILGQIEQAKQTRKACDQELMWYNAYCAKRLELTDGTITKGAAVDEPGCRSHSQRVAACEVAGEAYTTALSELMAWRKTSSESAKMRAATFEDQFIAAAKQCTAGG
jgi:hypothetical protein